jgi:DNA repair photolyase
MEAVARLAAAGIPTTVMVAPIIPALNDSELETIVEQAALAGAKAAHYVLLRLPLELVELFENWLQQHVPLKASHVMSLIRQSRGGKENESTFGKRMKGSGLFADMIAQRFKLAIKRHGLNRDHTRLDTSQFTCPAAPSKTSPAPQLDLFT